MEKRRGNETAGNQGKLIKRAFGWLGLLPNLLHKGPPKPSEPVRARESVSTPEKVLDPREFAAQVSDAVAEVVMSKLAASGLTAENIKKLATLCEAVSLDPTEGSEASSLVDAVSSKHPALGPTGGAKGSQVVRTPLHSDDSVLPPSSFSEDPYDSSTWATESNRRSSPHPFEMLPKSNLSPIQLSRRRKRATPEEDSNPPAKKGRHREVEYSHWTENDEVTHARDRLRDGRSQISSFSASRKIQVDTPLRRTSLQSPDTTTSEVSRQGSLVDAVEPGLTESPGMRKVRATQVNASH